MLRYCTPLCNKHRILAIGKFFRKKNIMSISRTRLAYEWLRARNIENSGFWRLQNMPWTSISILPFSTPECVVILYSWTPGVVTWRLNIYWISRGIAQDFFAEYTFFLLSENKVNIIYRNRMKALSSEHDCPKCRHGMSHFFLGRFVSAHDLICFDLNYR